MTARRFVLDSSVTMSWCFEDERNAYATSVLDQFSAFQAAVPSIWPLEIGNTIVVAERRKRLGEADSVRFFDLLSTLPIVVEQQDTERALYQVVGLARAHGLPTYDAAYLDLAMRMGLPIATLDKRLASAAEDCRVSLFQG